MVAITSELKEVFEDREALARALERLDEAEQAEAERLGVPLLPWRERLPLIYPRDFSLEFAPYHAEFWEWIEIGRASCRERV